MCNKEEFINHSSNDMTDVIMSNVNTNIHIRISDTIHHMSIRNTLPPKPFPKGDVRRYFTLLAAMDRPGGATLVQLERITGHNKGTIPADIAKIRERLCVTITKEGPIYRIKDIGPLLKKSGLKKCFISDNEFYV